MGTMRGPTVSQEQVRHFDRLDKHESIRDCNTTSNRRHLLNGSVASVSRAIFAIISIIIRIIIFYNVLFCLL